ncbi:hypothetical protein [Noviherbaspirillum sp.]|mgnify:CR=1 FL=1|uniref:hypothetical protein n=1 Tax=Noviherbaspirillum sp. TaxID=1926288 RepID=UPI002FE0BB4E
MQAAKKKLITLVVTTSIGMIVFGIWILAIYFGMLPEAKQYTPQPFADAFSGINALFAGCAFGGVIFTIWLQITELNETKDELKKTAEANEAMARANVELARSADERAVLEMFQTYCSDYFQTVKDSSMSVLIACVASRDYCEFVATRFFVAGQLPLPPGAWEKVSRVSYCDNFEEFVRQEQRNRYKLDELINFFTMLVGRSNAGNIVARCDVSYSWWRPLLWLIAKAQQNHYNLNPIVRQYATPMYLTDTLRKLDRIYSFESFRTDDDFWEFFLHHPKVRSYGLDDAYLARGSLASSQRQPLPATA